MRLTGVSARSPVQNSGDVAIWLGQGLRIDLETPDGRELAIEWPQKRDRPNMSWLTKSRALLFCGDAGRRLGPGKSRDYEEWHQRPAENEFEVVLSDAGQWQKLGKVNAVDYWSNKWGTREEYTHEVGPTSYLYRRATILVVKGKIDISSRGLVG